MIKKFIATNVDLAHAKAKRAFGNDVVMLNIRQLPSGDVEVTAGNQDDAAAYYRANPDQPPLDIEEHLQAAADAKNSNAPNHDDDDDEKSSRSRNSLFSFFSKKPAPEAEKKAPSINQINETQDQQFDEHNNGASQNSIEQQTNPEEKTQSNLEPSPTLDTVETSKPLVTPVHSSANQFPLNHPDNQNPTSQGSRLNEPLEKKFSENALSHLRERLTGQQKPHENFHDDPTTQSLVNLLRPHGISDRLLTMILNGARTAQVDDDLYRMGIGLSESFNFSPLRSSPSVPIMLVGPTGAGKTSCAAKLAALALSQGEGAMMITTDVGRAGALEQFATYSEKLAIECYAAETPEEIVTIMREVNPTGAVILDTPGISPYDAGDLAALKSFQTAISAEPILVLPASGDVGEYTDWAHAFRAFGVRSCIITKFDATRRVGAGLSAAFEGDMTLTYFSETPFISEGLLPASPEFLAYRLMANYPGRIVQK